MTWVEQSSALHPVELAAELHYRFILIHPFQDGNGRTVRMLVNLVLLQAGLTPAFTRPEELQGYEGGYRKALLAVDRSVPLDELTPNAPFDVRPLVAFLEEEVLWSLDQALDVVEGRVALTPDDFARRFAQLESTALGSVPGAALDEVDRRKVAEERIVAMTARLRQVLSPVIQRVNEGLKVSFVRLLDRRLEADVLPPGLTDCLGPAGQNPKGPIGVFEVYLGPEVGAPPGLELASQALAFVFVAEPHAITIGTTIEGAGHADDTRLVQPAAPDRWRPAEIERFALGALNRLLDFLQQQARSSTP